MDEENNNDFWNFNSFIYGESSSAMAAEPSVIGVAFQEEIM